MKKLLLILVILVVGCDMKPSSSEMEDAYRLIGEIEKFRQTHKQTPTVEEAWRIMESLGLKANERCRPCYARIDNDNYVVSLAA